MLDRAASPPRSMDFSPNPFSLWIELNTFVRTNAPSIIFFFSLFRSFSRHRIHLSTPFYRFFLVITTLSRYDAHAWSSCCQCMGYFRPVRTTGGAPWRRSRGAFSNVASQIGHLVAGWIPNRSRKLFQSRDSGFCSGSWPSCSRQRARNQDFCPEYTP